MRSRIDLRADSALAPSIDMEGIIGLVAKALSTIPSVFDHVGILVVNDDRMRELHKRYKGEDSTTDVLTFPMQEAAAGGGIEVDIVACADEAARRANEFGHTLERELLLYIVHGLLHCCGFNDHTDDDAARMHAEEDRILEAIGVGATYRPKGR